MTKEIGVREFLATWRTLTEPTSVANRGVTVGLWFPAGDDVILDQLTQRRIEREAMTQELIAGLLEDAEEEAIAPTGEPVTLSKEAVEPFGSFGVPRPAPKPIKKRRS